MLKNNLTAEVPICGRCRKPITDVCYALVSASIVIQENFGTATPQIFYNKESAENYAQQIPMDPTCWIETLRDHGVHLHDMTKLMNEAAKKAAEQPNPEKPQQKKIKGKRRRSKITK